MAMRKEPRLISEYQFPDDRGPGLEIKTFKHKNKAECNDLT